MRESERRFRAAVDNSTSAFIIYDRDRHISFVNTAALRVSGLDEATVIGRTAEEIFPARVARHHGTYLARAMETKQTQHSEFSYVLDGRRHSSIVDHVPLLDEKGELYQVLGIAVDTTERKEAEEKLRRRTAQLEATNDSLPAGYMEFAPDGSILHMNGIAQRVLGYTDEDFHVPHVQRLKRLGVLTAEGEPFPYDQLPSLRAMRGETVRDVIVKIQRPERAYWLSVSASPIRDGCGERLGVVMEFADVTHLRELQENLSRERNFLEAILRTAGALITVVDPNSHIVRFNRACEQLTGYTAQEVRNLKAIERLVPHDEREGVQRVLTRLEEGEPIVENENHWLTRTGDKRFIRWRNSALRDSDGRPAFIIATGIDITDRKRLEEQLDSRARQLVEVNEDLESFSYSVSHDLRAPLHTVVGFAGLLLEDYREYLDDEGQDYLRRIHHNIQHMQQLIDDLLSLSRVSRQEMVREEVDLSAMVRDHLTELTRSQPKRHVEFTVEDNVRANADRRLIAVALQNLLSNAWKFTSRKSATKIEFGTRSLDGRRTYFVRDNGAGFDPAFAQRIFEPFKRGHSEKAFRGTGIGLSIVQRIIKRHGGAIRAEGKPGDGAMFCFTLG